MAAKVGVLRLLEHHGEGDLDISRLRTRLTKWHSSMTLTSLPAGAKLMPKSSAVAPRQSPPARLTVSKNLQLAFSSALRLRWHFPLELVEPMETQLARMVVTARHQSSEKSND
jgi:hypothetical protein